MVTENTLCVGILCVIIPLAFLALRVVFVLPALRVNQDTRQSDSTKGFVSIRPGAQLMILLGSGGHTGEMLRLLNKSNIGACSRTWLASSGDTASLLKARDFEESTMTNSSSQIHYAELYRARKVGESVVSSILSTTKSIYSTAQKLRELPLPDVLLVNGPGTSVPVAYLLFMLKLIGVCKTRVVYIESLARVHNLSLSGRLILPIADRFIVQWIPLATKYRRAEYYGILV
ncbi:hypothetical protein OXX59_004564 [Metschnikowia pulcherrima]